MKRKGFTLVELIVTLIILSSILVIAIPAYNYVKKVVLERQYNSLVMLIETSANKYAAEEKITYLNVQQLIDSGYLETDDGTNIYDPRDKSVLNCRLIKCDKKKGNYKCKMQDTNECDLEKIEKKNRKISIAVVNPNTNEVLDNLDWLNFNVELKVKIEKEIGDSVELKKIMWSNSSGMDALIRDSYKTNVAENEFLNTTYRVKVELTDGSTLKASQDIKIDKTVPQIEKVVLKKWNTSSEPTMANYTSLANYTAGEWSNKKIFTTPIATDTGSGVNEYYVTTTGSQIHTNYNVTSNNYLSIQKEGITNIQYKVCDKAGNCSKYSDPKTIKLDTIPPKCGDVDPIYDTWTDKNRTITQKCDDGVGTSGCVKSNYITYYSGTKNHDSVAIYDNAGNFKTCEYAVLIDKVNPEKPTSEIRKNNSTGTILSNSTSWRNYNVWWGNFSASDTGGSKIDHYEYSTNCTGEKNGNLSSAYTYPLNGAKYMDSEFCIRAVDKAGNAGAWSSKYYFKIDKSAPTCSISLSGTKGNGQWYTSTATGTLTYSDIGSGVVKKGIHSTGTIFSSSNLWYNGKTTASLARAYDGHSYTGYVKDDAGNESTCISEEFGVDIAIPTLTSVSLTGTTSSEKRTLHIFGTDSVSGIPSKHENVKVEFRHKINSSAGEYKNYTNSNPTGKIVSSDWPYNNYEFTYKFGYASNSNNILYLKITLIDEAGNKSSKIKYKCKYSDNSCSVID